jgi:hypothetical protein
MSFVTLIVVLLDKCLYMKLCLKQANRHEIKFTLLSCGDIIFLLIRTLNILKQF